MTRLQKALSKIRNTEELASILGMSEHDVIMDLAVIPGDKLVYCDRAQCANCVADVTTLNCYDSVRDYLNTEIPDSDTQCKTKSSTEIIEMRENARRVLLTFMKNKFLRNASAEETGLILSHHISLLEQIGLFEKGELRKEFLEYLEKLL
jgi:hypothetical protein